MLKVVWDVGEAGWALYHRAHLQWLKENVCNPPDVVVWTLPDRKRFYDGDLAKEIRTDLPKELLSPFLVRNNWGWNNGPNFTEMLSKCNINQKELIHDFKDLERYKDKMVFKPFTVYPHEQEAYDKLTTEFTTRDNENIVLFPRSKYGAAFTEYRNWGHIRWLKLYGMLIDKMPEYNIIVAGKLGECYRLGFTGKRALHIVNENPLDEILWVLNDPKTVLAVSSQSFCGKLALLQNVDTLMWGHEKQRHQVDENWSSNSNVKCHFIEDRNYSLPPELIFETIEDLVK